jgi:hypothetical protein
MASSKNKIPDFFDEDELDPVETATGLAQPAVPDKAASPAAAASPGQTTAKKKAGFYLSVDLLNRFAHKFHELKLSGAAIENKSTLLEAALGYALDDMDKGEESQVLRKLAGKS